MTRAGAATMPVSQPFKTPPPAGGRGSNNNSVVYPRTSAGERAQGEERTTAAWGPPYCSSAESRADRMLCSGGGGPLPGASGGPQLQAALTDIHFLATDLINNSSVASSGVASSAGEARSSSAASVGEINSARGRTTPGPKTKARKQVHRCLRRWDVAQQAMSSCPTCVPAGY